MSVQSEESWKSYDTDGITTTFVVPYEFELETDLVVRLFDAVNGGETTLTLTSDYTTTGEGDPNGGTIETTVTYDSGFELSIENSPPLTQLKDYTTSSRYPAQKTEGGLDKATRISQSLKRMAERALRGPNSEDPIPELPDSILRADSVLGFDNNGDVDLTVSLQNLKNLVSDGAIIAFPSNLTYYKNRTDLLISELSANIGLFTEGTSFKTSYKDSNEIDGSGWHNWVLKQDVSLSDNGGTILHVVNYWYLVAVGCDIPNAGMFGTLNDGTECSAAMQLALNSGPTYWPPGVYDFLNPITIKYAVYCEGNLTTRFRSAVTSGDYSVLVERNDSSGLRAEIGEIYFHASSTCGTTNLVQGGTTGGTPMTKIRFKGSHFYSESPVTVNGLDLQYSWNVSLYDCTSFGGQSQYVGLNVLEANSLSIIGGEWSAGSTGCIIRGGSSMFINSTFESSSQDHQLDIIGGAGINIVGYFEGTGNVRVRGGTNVTFLNGLMNTNFIIETDSDYTLLTYSGGSGTFNRGDTVTQGATTATVISNAVNYPVGASGYLVLFGQSGSFISGSISSSSGGTATASQDSKQYTPECIKIDNMNIAPNNRFAFVIEDGLDNCVQIGRITSDNKTSARFRGIQTKSKIDWMSQKTSINVDPNLKIWSEDKPLWLPLVLESSSGNPRDYLTITKSPDKSIWDGQPVRLTTTGGDPSISKLAIVDLSHYLDTLVGGFGTVQVGLTTPDDYGSGYNASLYLNNDVVDTTQVNLEARQGRTIIFNLTTELINRVITSSDTSLYVKFNVGVSGNPDGTWLDINSVALNNGRRNTLGSHYENEAVPVKDFKRIDCGWVNSLNYPDDYRIGTDDFIMVTPWVYSDLGSSIISLLSSGTSATSPSSSWYLGVLDSGILGVIGKENTEFLFSRGTPYRITLSRQSGVVEIWVNKTKVFSSATLSLSSSNYMSVMSHTTSSSRFRGYASGEYLYAKDTFSDEEIKSIVDLTSSVINMGKTIVNLAEMKDVTSSFVQKSGLSRMPMISSEINPKASSDEKYFIESKYLIVSSSAVNLGLNIGTDILSDLTLTKVMVKKVGGSDGSGAVLRASDDTLGTNTTDLITGINISSTPSIYIPSSGAPSTQKILQIVPQTGGGSCDVEFTLFFS